MELLNIEEQHVHSCNAEKLVIYGQEEPLIKFSPSSSYAYHDILNKCLAESVDFNLVCN
jgi:hypothetical protein